MKSQAYCLLIRCGPHHQAQALTAYQFAHTLLQAGHTIERVFFYQQGVLTASLLNTPAQDEINITKQWQALQTEHHLQLDVCIAAALKHGIYNKEEAVRYNQPCSNLATGFTLAGLGQLAVASACSDRLVTFGGGL